MSLLHPSYCLRGTRLRGIRLGERGAFAVVPSHHMFAVQMYGVCLKSLVNGTRKETKQKIRTN
jgi:hypothetical protein